MAIPAARPSTDGRPLPAAVPAAPVPGRVLDHERRRAAAFAADRDALAGPEQDQQDRREPPDRVVPGQQPDAGGDHRHEQDAGRQGPPAAEPVAVVGEQQGAGRAGQEGHAEDREGREQPAGRVGFGEEGGRDDGGERSVEGKVIPLDEVADAAGDQSAPSRVGGGGLLDPLGLATDARSLGLLHAPLPSEP